METPCAGPESWLGGGRSPGGSLHLRSPADTQISGGRKLARLGAKVLVLSVTTRPARDVALTNGRLWSGHPGRAVTRGRSQQPWACRASAAGRGSPGQGRPTHSYALCELLSNMCPGPHTRAFRAATVSPNSKARGGTKAEKLNPVGSELKNLPQTHLKCFIKLALPCATHHDFLSPLDQWFSTGDNLPPPPPGGHVEVSRDVFGCGV